MAAALNRKVDFTSASTTGEIRLAQLQGRIVVLDFQQFGVIKMKNMYGRQVRGIERSTFVIDRDGRLCRDWRGVKVAGHVEQVLAFVQSL